jgi:transposase-like protein
MNTNYVTIIADVEQICEIAGKDAIMVRICPFCHKRTLRKYDLYRYKGQVKQRYICESCGRITANPHYKKI